MRSRCPEESRRRARRGIVLVLPVAALTLATACGGANDPTPPPETPTVAVTFTATAPSEPLSVGAVVWALSIDPVTNAPQDRVDAFDVAAPILFATLPVHNLLAMTEIRAGWTYNGTSLDAVSTTTVSQTNLLDGWIEFHLAREATGVWPDGTYTIAVSVNGQVVQSAEVAVASP